MGIDDWMNEPGKVTKTAEIPLLDPAVEYILQLDEITKVDGVTKQFMGKSKTITEIRTVWKVEGQNVKVWQNFNFSWNKKSNLVTFIERLYETVLREDGVYTVGEFFKRDMRIRCHLELQDGSNAESRFYNINQNTLRRYNAGTPAPTPAPTQAPAPAQDYKLDPQLNAPANPDVDRVASFLQAGNFSDRSQAEKCCMEFMGISDPAIFAAAWNKAKGATAGGK